jgi:hypothetical protein
MGLNVERRDVVGPEHQQSRKQASIIGEAECRGGAMNVCHPRHLHFYIFKRRRTLHYDERQSVESN